MMNFFIPLEISLNKVYTSVNIISYSPGIIDENSLDKLSLYITTSKVDQQTQDA